MVLIVCFYNICIIILTFLLIFCAQIVTSLTKAAYKLAPWAYNDAFCSAVATSMSSTTVTINTRDCQIYSVEDGVSSAVMSIRTSTSHRKLVLTGVDIMYYITYSPDSLGMSADEAWKELTDNLQVEKVVFSVF